MINSVLDRYGRPAGGNCKARHHVLDTKRVIRMQVQAFASLVFVGTYYTALVSYDLAS